MWLIGLAFAAGTAPTAEAGLGVLAYSGDTVVLNGTASADVDGESLSYRWLQVAGPTVQLNDGPTAEPSFVVPEPGYYRFSLTVNDSTLDSEPDTVGFVVADREATPDGSTGCASVPGTAVGVLITLSALMLPQRRKP